ncbi:SDR family NAD(P)-dependent oxidoreductase [Nonomuraea sp. NPDC050536]|uniref:SDR family NAD(P)-dependent oxidoreductase n=1 Tax=Nonomuraea sp. NPDC050536 TaxID=3364366 RepID=UPI0037C97F8D
MSMTNRKPQGARPDVPLEGKVAIVTGAAQGIGNAIAHGLAADGAHVVIADLHGVEEAAQALPQKSVGIEVDVADEHAVARMAEETITRFGGIDLLVNNAGLFASLAMRPFTEIPLAEWRRVMDVNVASMFLTCQAVVPHMRERGGKIVNISSATPFLGVPHRLHYVTSKGAIIAFTRALAKELGPDGINVNCIAPGFTLSAGVLEHGGVPDQLSGAAVSARAIKRDQQPEDLVGAALFLCRPMSDFVTGQTLVVDGGLYLH